jgi:hypothetical protein
MRITRSGVHTSDLIQPFHRRHEESDLLLDRGVQDGAVDVTAAMLTHGLPGAIRARTHVSRHLDQRRCHLPAQEPEDIDGHHRVCQC